MKLVAGIITVSIGFAVVAAADTTIAFGLAIALLGLNLVVRKKQ